MRLLHDGPHPRIAGVFRGERLHRDAQHFLLRGGVAFWFDAARRRNFSVALARGSRQPHGERLLLTALTQHRHFDGLPGLLEAHLLLQLRRVVDRLAVERDDHVTRLEARVLRGRWPVGEALDHDAADLLQAHRLGVLLPGVLDADAHDRPLHVAGLHQLLHHGAREVDRDREAVTRVEPRLTRDRRVDADHLALDVDQRAARVARVDRRVGLNKVLDAVVRPRQATEGAALRADDPGGHGEGELLAERIPDRQRPLAHPRRVGIAETDRREVLGVDPDHRHVGVRIGADHLGREFAFVVQLDRHPVRAGDDVVVRQDVPVGRDDKARARPLLDTRPPPLRKEVLEPRGEALVVGALDVLRLDEHHRRLHVLGHRDEPIAEIGHGLGDRDLDRRCHGLSGNDGFCRPALLRQTERGRERQPEHECEGHQGAELQPISRTYRHLDLFSLKG